MNTDDFITTNCVVDGELGMIYKVITRHSETDSFHDTYWEAPEKFVKRVLEEAKKLKGSSIQFCETYAVIVSDSLEF